MGNLQKCLIPTSKTTSSAPVCNRPQLEQNAQYALAANSLLETISLNQESIREWAILDSGATSHFLVIDAPCDDVKPELNLLTV